MTAEIIILAHRRPPSVSAARAEIERLRAYAQRYIATGRLQAFSDDELDDLERLIVQHSMLVEFVAGNGEVAEQQIIFLD